MNHTEIANWITDNLTNPGTRVFQDSDTSASWRNSTGPNGNAYDALIRNTIIGARLFIIRENVEDAINFANHENKPAWNQKKLTRVVNEIILILSMNNDDFHTEYHMNTGFRISKI